MDILYFSVKTTLFVRRLGEELGLRVKPHVKIENITKEDYKLV